MGAETLPEKEGLHEAFGKRGVYWGLKRMPVYRALIIALSVHI